jgi:hypothetical protein
MAVVLDKSSLGDINLSPAEAVKKATEENRKLASVHRIPDQTLLENHDMAEGRPMEWSELARRICKLNHSLVVEPGGVFGAVAVRLIGRGEAGEVEKKYVTGFYMDKLPEYSRISVDKNGLPVAEDRGWRSVLQMLIHGGAITKAQADREFGAAFGQRTELWDRNLRK